jgi:hypothetical protein
MRSPLTRAFGAALLTLALLVPRLGRAADARPVVRIVLMAGGDTPPWFDGFVKHLERELGLRGIDVSVARSGHDAPSLRTSGIPASSATPDAELVVDAPSALRPVLRFAAPPRDPAASEAGSAGRLRQVNLAGVPADGWALALAASADELMRSNWPRAVPAEPPRAKVEEGSVAASAGEGTTGSAPAKAPAEAQRPAPAKADTEPSSVTARSGTSGDVGSDAGTEPSGAARSTASTSPWNVGMAAAGEAFAGGQTQMGADLRGSLRVLPRIDLEVRGGWRRILRQQTTNGAVDGSAWVLGGALRIHVLGGARGDLSLVGRADLLRVAYSGDPRDASVDATPGSALGFVVAAGPRGRIALTRALGLEAEVLAGASPLATTATDAGNAVFATNGAAFLGSLGLSFGF